MRLAITGFRDDRNYCWTTVDHISRGRNQFTEEAFAADELSRASANDSGCAELLGVSTARDEIAGPSRYGLPSDLVDGLGGACGCENPNWIAVAGVPLEAPEIGGDVPDLVITP